jgi:hypothetical protein
MRYSVTLLSFIKIYKLAQKLQRVTQRQTDWMVIS